LGAALASLDHQALEQRQPAGAVLGPRRRHVQQAGMFLAQAVAELPKNHRRPRAIAVAAPDKGRRPGHGHQIGQQRLLQWVVALRQACFRI
jgi:hypothetical protein